MRPRDGTGGLRSQALLLWGSSCSLKFSLMFMVTERTCSSPPLNKRPARERTSQDEKANQQRDAEIAEANRKAAEAEGQTRKLQQLTAPRVLSQAEKNKITAFLAGKPVGAFVIKATIVVPDARPYAEQIAAIFRDVGWSVEIGNAMFTGSDITGLWITVQNGQTAPLTASIVQQALAAGRITARVEVDPTMNPNDVWLSIGAK